MQPIRPPSPLVAVTGFPSWASAHPHPSFLPYWENKRNQNKHARAFITSMSRPARDPWTLPPVPSQWLSSPCLDARQCLLHLPTVSPFPPQSSSTPQKFFFFFFLIHHHLFFSLLIYFLKSMSILPNFKMHKTFIYPVPPLAIIFVSHFPVKQNITASNFPPVVCQIYYIHNFTDNSSINIHPPSRTTCSPGWLAIVLLPGFSHLQTINLEESRTQPPNSSLYLHLSWCIIWMHRYKHRFCTKQHPHMYLWTGPLAQRCRTRRGVVYSTFLLGYLFSVSNLTRLKVNFRYFLPNLLFLLFSVLQ